MNPHDTCKRCGCAANAHAIVPLASAITMPEAPYVAQFGQYVLGVFVVGEIRLCAPGLAASLDADGCCTCEACGEVRDAEAKCIAALLPQEGEDDDQRG